nr:MAG TPA: zinc-finger double domain protein [Inoviridae sp.]
MVLSDKIAEGSTLQCDFCRTNFVGQNRCSTPEISGTL